MDWTRGRTIGRGSSATVSIAMAHRSGQVFAIKSAELSQSEFLQREQRILSTLKCPQIIAYKGFNVTSENGKLLYNLCMEYAPGGTLIDAIRERGGGCLGEATIRSYARDMLHGLRYLHSNGIVHCDIKGSNVLITNDGVKIADLGCAKRVDEVSAVDSTLTVPIAGTPLFMAPEVARGEQQGFAADVWALGCTVIEMATGRAPWADVSDPVSALYRIGFSGDAPEIPESLSKQAKDFLGKCLKRDPGERWLASELVKHAFLEEPNFISKEIYGSNSDTPTCVLDQGFWDSMEEWETARNSTHSNSSWDSPKERIQRLSGRVSTAALMVPNWAWEENWVTVRSNGIKEGSQEYSTVYANEATTSETNTAWISQDNSLTSLNNPRSSGKHTRNTSRSRDCSFGDRYKNRGLFMDCTCKKDDLCRNINFETNRNLLCVPFNLIFLAWRIYIMSSTLPQSPTPIPSFGSPFHTTTKS